MKTLKVIGLSVFLLSVGAVQAATDPHETDREELRALLGDIETAMNSKDFELAMKHLDTKVVITYHTADVSYGPDGARDYYNKMIGGKDALIKNYRIKGQVSTPAEFQGNTAVAHGTTAETYSFADGVDFNLKGRWTAALHKNDGKWKVLALHFSTSVTDNPVLNNATRLTRVIGVVAFVAGVLLGVLGTWLAVKCRK